MSSSTMSAMMAESHHPQAGCPDRDRSNNLDPSRDQEEVVKEDLETRLTLASERAGAVSRNVAFAALKRLQVVMARVLLALAVVGLLLSTLGCGAPAAPTCEGSERLKFADGSTVPLCDLEMSLAAVGGRPSLSVWGLLPARGPYGAGEELAAFTVTVYPYDGSGESPGSGMIDVLPNRGGLFVGTGSGTEWQGDCRVAARKGGLGIDCELRGNAGAALPIMADLPSAPDPRADAELRWLE